MNKKKFYKEEKKQTIVFDEKPRLEHDNFRLNSNDNTLDKSKNIILLNQTKENDYRLYLIIGEEVHEEQKEFKSISLYIRGEDNNPILYANIDLPYIINNSTFIDIEDDPRYIFKENYNKDVESYSYSCMLKPFGNLKGVYRIMDMTLIKIRNIEPLIDEETTNKLIKKMKKY